MTEQPTDGGPAFPGPSFTQGGIPNGHSMGMSLRDWFAGQAMRDTFAALAVAGQANFNEYQLRRCAKMSYIAADAMLAARGGDA